MEPGVGAPVRYRDRVSEAAWQLLPDRVVGSRHRGLRPNADFVLPVAAVRAGRGDAERKLLAA